MEKLSKKLPGDEGGSVELDERMKAAARTVLKTHSPTPHRSIGFGCRLSEIGGKAGNGKICKSLLMLNRNLASCAFCYEMPQLPV